MRAIKAESMAAIAEMRANAAEFRGTMEAMIEKRLARIREPAAEPRGDARVRLEGPETLLKPDAAQAVAVILHELVTNASKYKALSDTNGQIKLTWSHAEDGQLTLRWTELGGPRVTVPERQGFGSRLIERTISQLSGKARFDWSSEGLVCEIALQA